MVVVVAASILNILVVTEITQEVRDLAFTPQSDEIQTHISQFLEEYIEHQTIEKWMGEEAPFIPLLVEDLCAAGHASAIRPEREQRKWYTTL